MTSQQQIIPKNKEKEKCNLLDMSQPHYNLSFNNNEGKGLRWVLTVEKKERKIQRWN
jgi:hypothetical protein